jgi:hypothetical protein
VLRWLWVLVPLVSLGIAAFVPPAYFAVRHRRRSGYVWAVLLLVAISAFFIVNPGDNKGGVRNGLAIALIMVCWVGGATVAGGYVITTTDESDPVSVARRQRQLRERARRLVEKDPRLAIEAHVGRPDLRGAHDDGGLVDVNRVPAATLAKLPGIDAALAERIVATRRDVGGYSSLADLVTTLDLDPTRLDDASDELVFIPLDLEAG